MDNLWNKKLLLGTHLPFQSALHKAISVNNTKKRRSLLLVVAWAQVNCIKHTSPSQKVKPCQKQASPP